MEVNYEETDLVNLFQQYEETVFNDLPNCWQIKTKNFRGVVYCDSVHNPIIDALREHRWIWIFQELLDIHEIRNELESIYRNINSGWGDRKEDAMIEVLKQITKTYQIPVNGLKAFLSEEMAICALANLGDT